jgi:mRNA interferase MazF
VVYVPLTTQNRGSRYEIELGRVRFLNEMSVANVQGIGSIPANAMTEIYSWARELA